MQIFAPHPDPTESARALDDLRLRRQMQEGVQLLCSWLSWRKLDAPWKPCPMPHAIREWLNRDDRNVGWLRDYCRAIKVELLHRFGPRTGMYVQCLVFELVEEHLEHVGWGVAPAMFCNYTSDKKRGLDFTRVEDVHLAYREFLNGKWLSDVRDPVWTGRDHPTFKDHRANLPS